MGPCSRPSLILCLIILHLLSKSYNGGKDCNVLLVLLDCFSRFFLPSSHPSHDILSKICTIYFHHPNTFLEVIDFMEFCTKVIPIHLLCSFLLSRRVLLCSSFTSPSVPLPLPLKLVVPSLFVFFFLLFPFFSL
jgi:hypothetical protein